MTTSGLGKSTQLLTASKTKLLQTIKTNVFVWSFNCFHKMALERSLSLYLSLISDFLGFLKNGGKYIFCIKFSSSLYIHTLKYKFEATEMSRGFKKDVKSGGLRINRRDQSLVILVRV